MNGVALDRIRSRLRFYAKHGPTYWAESRPGRGMPTSLLRRLKDILDGFHPNEADWYRQIRGNVRGVVTNFDRERHLHGVNGHYAYVLDNKALFNELARQRGIPTPEVFAEYCSGSWHWRQDGRAALHHHLNRTGRFIIKPTLGSKGRSIHMCRGREEIESYCGEDAIATTFVAQADYAQAIFPESLNTMRVLMMRDVDGGPFIAVATHRFGTKNSAPVDNFSAKGLVAKIDRETGQLDRAITIEDANKVVFHDRHPETQAAIAGTILPRWDEVRSLVNTLGAAFPYLVYVGWDIAITTDGPVVIEGNAHPSLRFFQFYDCLLDDPQLRRAFSRHITDLAAKGA
ncbi:sugar-transfer associated ATP-grasp domain-containing protein [Nitratireductor sp. GCM10026969]|uniref:sugar-transfer associated ATP-grasp domain-containing protein n=1 Tax=Nitratireductor sp. GCM10026969 TaxID=3252645 RepID=UPI003610D435